MAAAPTLQASVYVLLSPGSPTGPPPNLQASKVCVMGLHKSGTHVVSKYLRKFFHVTVEPKEKVGKSDDGTISLGEFQLWKHTVPLTSLENPIRRGGIGSGSHGEGADLLDGLSF